MRRMSRLLPPHDRRRRQAPAWWVVGLVAALLWLQHARWAHAAEHAHERRHDHAVSTAVCALCVAHASLDGLPGTATMAVVPLQVHALAVTVPWVSATPEGSVPYRSRAPPA